MHWVYRRRKGQVLLDPRDTHHSSDRYRWHRQKQRKTQDNPQIRYSLTAQRGHSGKQGGLHHSVSNPPQNHRSRWHGACDPGLPGYDDATQRQG